MSEMSESFEVTADEAAKAMADIEDHLETAKSSPRQEYLDGVKDALGWVLGHYERPTIS